jgi:nucleotide-binding universal stress UspA family protein
MTPLINQRILVATDDSAAGLEASRWAVDLAARYSASLRVLHVLADSDVTTALVASGTPRLSERRHQAVRSLFRYVSGLAAAAGVAVETLELSGEPAARILEQARSWPADLVVIGRGEPRGTGGPWVGKETRMVLEFAEQPVLVVPAARSRDRGHDARLGGDH